MSWFTVLRLLLYRSVLELFSNSFKVFHCSVINVRCCYFQQLVYFIMFASRCQQLFYFSLLSFQATACLSYHRRSALSTTFFLAVFQQLSYIIMYSSACQQLFSFFITVSGEGGIWTLAPLLTTCTLSRGVPSASLGTSPNCITY